MIFPSIVTVYFIDNFICSLNIFYPIFVDKNGQRIATAKSLKAPEVAGYTIEVQNNTAFVAAYTYDGSGAPVWYASGPATLNGNAYMGSWTSYAGGQTLTGTFHAPTGTSNAGTLSIQFTSPTAATLTLPDGRQIPIQRYSF